MNAPLPSDERQRLAALHECAVLDTAPEGAFDDITRLAAECLHAPISLVSLVDESRQWFKSRHGLAVAETPRAHSFCAHAILEPGRVFEVEDARRDPRFADNPMVTGEPHIRFYAGVALTTSDGRALGTLNVIDTRARRLSERDKDLLSILGRQVTAQLELRRKACELRNEAQERVRSEAAIRREYEQVIGRLRDAAEAVQASERRFRALAESSAIGIVEADSGQGVIYVNDRAAEMAGRPPAQCLGAGWIESLHPTDRERIAKAWQAVLRDRRSFQDHFRFQHPGGRVVDVLVDGRALIGGPDQSDRYVATLVDVTVLRELEEHRLARLAAERANQAKSDFLARMSHELRTPLNAILGFAQLMQIDPAVAADARNKQRVDCIRQAGDHLLHLINEVLDLARVEAGHLELRLEAVAPASVAAQCLRLVEPQAQARGIVFEVDLTAAERAAVRADEVRLREILLNLLSNAVKYNRPGGWIRLAASADAAVVTIRVQDAGAGLGAEQLAQLFQPFNRLGAERTDVEGTGLGLAISKRLAEAMGARLHAASEPGRGSTFTLALPRAAG